MDPSYLKDQAERCRRWERATDHAGTRAMYTEMAERFEAKQAALDAELKGTPSKGKV
jgi:hypothetical protein